MQVKVVYPDDPDELAALQGRVAEEHAKIIVNYIQRLPCSDAEKNALFQYVRQKLS